MVESHKESKAANNSPEDQLILSRRYIGSATDKELVLGGMEQMYTDYFAKATFRTISTEEIERSRIERVRGMLR